ncbi:hypothetical protein KSF73_16030 [Burkholderiaceae bacterium DAT-1]|nr:hypothetical protein [Burkholderiaceae bacterium DAT-1]
MPIEFRRNVAVVTGSATVEEAEGLREWLQKKKSAKVDLAACTHLHSANLQVLMAGKQVVTAWPERLELAVWLRAALE